MRRLLLLVCVLGCDPRSRFVAASSSCLALNWPDSLSDVVPHQVRLDSTFEFRFPSPVDGYRVVKPVAPGDWAQLADIKMAWWLVRNDSLVLMLNGVDAGWTVRLHGRGDSLSGIYVSPGLPASMTFPITARRYSCAESRGSGA